MTAPDFDAPSSGNRSAARSRRVFLAGALGAIAGGCATATKPAAARAPTAEPLVGSQLFGWGQYYAREGRKLEDHLDEVLGLIRECGFDYAEHGLNTREPEATWELAERMTIEGLRPVSLYTGGAMHVLGKASETAERIIAAARIAKKSGFTVIVFNPDPIGRDKTEAELEIQAAALRELGEEFKKLGMQLGLHHHTPELRAGAREFHSNFRRTNPAEVGFCYDVHWIFRGGIPPEQVLPAYGDRVVSWHLRQSRNQVWWEDLAPGDIDYGYVAQFAREQNLPRRYTVELALEEGTIITRTAKENHRRSREFVRDVFGV